MSHSSTLSHINSTISHKLGEVEHQIDKLKEAKREIESLQEEGVSEIRDILSTWTIIGPALLLKNLMTGAIVPYRSIQNRYRQIRRLYLPNRLKDDTA